MKMNATTKDAGFIFSIAFRAQSMFPAKFTGNRLDLEMDLTAAHLNGSELDLEGLLKADNFNFSHDIFGIVRYIDRETGKLTQFFTPRHLKQSYNTSTVIFHDNVEEQKKQG